MKLLAESEPNAFIYKFRIPGTSGYYRGHIFISMGLIKKFFDTLGTTVDVATPEEIDRVLIAFQGVLVHEMFHPKQDELVKWEARKSHDTSANNHIQFDELSTDVMAADGLKKANLEEKSLFEGLELLFGLPLGRTYNIALEAALAAVQTHPERELRLNLARGVLSYLRQDSGKTEVNPIKYDHQNIKAELEIVLAGNTLKERMLVKFENDPIAGRNAFISVLYGLKEEISRMDSFQYDFFKPFETYMNELVRIVRSGHVIGDSEKEAYFQFIKFTLRSDISKKILIEYFLTQNLGGSASGQGASFVEKARHVQFAQRVYNNLLFFNDGNFKENVKKLLAENYNTIVKGEKNSTILGSLSFFVPESYAKETIEKVLSTISDLNTKDQVMTLTRLWVNTIVSNGDPAIEVKIIDHILKIIRKDVDGAQLAGQYLGNVFKFLENDESFYFRYLRSLEIKGELFSKYSEFAFEVLSAPGNEYLFQTIAGTSDRESKMFWKMILWHIDMRNVGQTIKGQKQQLSNFKLEKLTPELIKVIQSKPWHNYLSKLVKKLDSDGPIDGRDLQIEHFLRFFESRQYLGRGLESIEKIMKAFLFHPSLIELGVVML